MFDMLLDKLWEESPMVQRMREQMREELQEELREKYYEKGKKEGLEKGRTEGVEKGRAEVVAETLQHALMMVIQVEFPELIEPAQKKIESMTDPGVLDLLFQQVLTAPDIKTARWLLEPALGQ